MLMFKTNVRIYSAKGEDYCDIITIIMKSAYIMLYSNIPDYSEYI